MSLLRVFLGMVADSLRRRRRVSERRRTERALRRRGLYLVVDFERGTVGPTAGPSSTFSSPVFAEQVAGQLHAKTGRVHVVARIVTGVPLGLFEELAFGSEDPP